MNKNEFAKALYFATNSYNVDLKFINSWYQEIHNSLKVIKSQAKGIKHPRHLGDFLESEVGKLLRSLLPQKYLVEKGIALNDFSAVSQEQDLLIIDGALGSPICETDGIGYYPIESVIGSIEVKSNLDLSELRKSLVSCSSLKKLPFPPFNYDATEDKRIFYAIFAYSSSCKEKSFESELQHCIEKIPETLRPNLIYILDRGLYIPTTGGNIVMDLKSIQSVMEGYKAILNQSKTEAQNIILYFSLIIEHAFQQSSIRKPAKYTSYVLNPSLWEKHLESRGKLNVPVRMFINQHTRWHEKHGELITIYEEKCSVCNSPYKFYPLPPGSKKHNEGLSQSLEKDGCIPLPKSLHHRCSCGNTFEISEAKIK